MWRGAQNDDDRGTTSLHQRVGESGRDAVERAYDPVNVPDADPDGRRTLVLTATLSNVPPFTI